MNMQQRADRRSIALHKKIATKIRNNPALIEIPKRNIKKWRKKRYELPAAIKEWEIILNTYSFNKILSLLESNSEEAIRLRSSSPFTNILNEQERNEIFELYRKTQ